MARPPALAGNIPSVTADWQWSGTWPVTTPAVLSGAWRLPAENRLVLLWANVTDQAVTASLRYDLRAAGLTGRVFARRQRGPAADADLPTTGPDLQESLTFEPRHVWAWEFSVKE
jgi:hypothetical protein